MDEFSAIIPIDREPCNTSCQVKTIGIRDLILTVPHAAERTGVKRSLPPIAVM